MRPIARIAATILTILASFAVSRLALAWVPSSAEIFVDAAAPAGGDGASRATAYRTIQEAVNDANASLDAPTIFIAAGTYVEVPNITITKDGVRLRGTTEHVLDVRGLPTGQVVAAAIVMPSVATAPAGTALLRIHASDVEVTGLVFDGGFPRPAPGPTGRGIPLLRADGAAAQRPLVGLHIHGNSILNTTQAMLFRLSSATISGNFIARNTFAMTYYGGFAATAGFEDPEQHVVFDGNRIVDHVSAGTTFFGVVGSLVAPTFASLGLAPGPGVNHIIVMNNDFARNGDARTPFNGISYPQPIQYSGLVLATAQSEGNHPLQSGRIEATVGFNTFLQNGYGIGVLHRMSVLTPAQAPSSVEAQLIDNRYCGNAFNAMIANFSVISQSHGATGAGQTFRYAQDSTYKFDATRDVLTEDDLDWDHPETDPRLPLAGILGNTLLFNGAMIPNGVKLTRPPVISEGPPVVYGAPVTTPDTTPPDITTASATPSTLWPPNGNMQPVQVEVGANDRCDPAPVCKIVSVTSDQQPRPGPDWILTAPLALELRAERQGGADDRTYTVTVACTDASGNASSRDVAIRVPHDRRH